MNEILSLQAPVFNITTNVCKNKYATYVCSSSNGLSNLLAGRLFGKKKLDCKRRL